MSSAALRIRRRATLENLDGEFTVHELAARSRQLITPDAGGHRTAYYALWYRCTRTGRARQWGLLNDTQETRAALRGIPDVEVDGENFDEILAHRRAQETWLDERGAHTWAEQWAEFFTKLVALERHASRQVVEGLAS